MEIVKFLLEKKVNTEARDHVCRMITPSLFLYFIFNPDSYDLSDIFLLFLVEWLECPSLGYLSGLWGNCKIVTGKEG